MNILVTGATGYLGAEVVHALLGNREHRLSALVRRQKKFQRLFQWCRADSQRLIPVQADIGQLQRLPPDIDTIIHTAAFRFDSDLAEAQKVNIEGTANLLRLAADANVKRFIFTSSQSVYGMKGAPWNEEAKLDPQTVYAKTKYAAEQLIQKDKGAMDFVILRFSRLYGVSLFMRWEELIGKFARLVRDGRPLPVHGDGRQRFDLLHIKDAAQCLLRLLQIYPRGWNNVYNIGSGGSVSLNELVEHLSKIAAELGLPPVKIERQPEMVSNSPRHLELNIGHARDELGWSPRQTLSEGLREYLGGDVNTS
ncbi:MAG: NAD(P)-dependent oxidoreductase [Dehalococcoidia bacterium]|jgi:nucleoside-diphosphate-sugar epimerase